MVYCQYWLELMDNAELRSFNLPGLAFQRSLLNAANNRRVGETVLLALINLGPEGPSSASPATLAAVAQALTAVGLSGEANALVLEAMLGAGI